MLEQRANPAPAVIPAASWARILALDAAVPACRGVARAFSLQTEPWTEWLLNKDPVSGTMPVVVREVSMCPVQHLLLCVATCYEGISSPILPPAHDSGNCMLPIAATTTSMAMKQADHLQRTGLESAVQRFGVLALFNDNWPCSMTQCSN